MRHGRRLDDIDTSLNHPDYHKYKSWVNAENAKGSQARIYDPPLLDYVCVAETAATFKQNFTQISKIVSSPFLRCIQTAAGVAAKCGLNKIYINNNLGEEYETIKGFLKGTSMIFSLLESSKQLLEANKAYTTNGGKGELSIEYSALGDTPWSNDLSGYSRRRMKSAIEEERKSFTGNPNSLLLVTHGGFSVILQGANAPIRDTPFLANYCGFYFYDPKGILRSGTNIHDIDFNSDIIKALQKYNLDMIQFLKKQKNNANATAAARWTAERNKLAANAAAPQKICPSCTMSNPASNKECIVCGTDLTNVPITPATAIVSKGGFKKRRSEKRKRARKTQKTRKSRSSQ